MSSKDETRAKEVKKKGRKGGWRVLKKQPTISILSQYKEGSIRMKGHHKKYKISVWDLFMVQTDSHTGKG